MSDEKMELNVGRSLRPDTKICGVCGASALGYNFDAVTCESCKAFFRRNALKNKEFRCPFSNQCKITSVTRRFCQKCRLQKCFSIGMKKELIMTDEDKEKKRRKIEENRITKKWKKQIDNPAEVAPLADNRVSSTSVITHSISNDTDKTNVLYTKGKCELFVETQLQPQPVVNTLTVYQPAEGGVMTFPSPRAAPSPPPDTACIAVFSDSQLNERELSLAASVPSQYPNNNIASYSEIQSTPVLTSLVSAHETLCDPMAASAVNSTYYIGDEEEQRTRNIIQEILNIPTSPPDSIDSVLSDAIKLEFESYTTFSNSLTTVRNDSRQLTAAEYAKLNELIVAHRDVRSPVNVDIGRGHVTDMKDVFTLFAIAIRRLIKMAKRISAFRNMCQEDQIALLKGSCTEMMILRSVMSYDPDNNQWKIPHATDATASIKLDILKTANNNIYEEYHKFLHMFEEQYRTDENIMLILCAIALFSPDRSRIVHKDVIKLEQNSYYYLLRRYLESLYPGCEARSMFLKLLQKIRELHKINESHMRFFLELHPNDVEPLLIEIFDLKPC